MKNFKLRKGKIREKEKKERGVSLRRTPPFIISAFFFLFLLTLIGLTYFTYQLLYRSDYFIIKESRVDWLTEPLSKSSYGEFTSTGIKQNIFKFDISSASDEILRGHPEFKNVRIVRAFPCRLMLKIEPRVPIAQVGEDSLFLVDPDGVILTEAQDYIRDDLPIITGVGWRLFRRVGQKEDSPRMTNALSFLKVIKESDFLDDHRLTKIDVSDHRNVSFYIEDGLEIKIGHSDFKKRLELLDKALSSMVIDRDEIKYIDLRFDDVVLGTK